MLDTLEEHLRRAGLQDSLGLMVDYAKERKGRAVPLLIQIAESGRRRLDEHTSLENQLNAIEALGETGSGVARWYVDRIVLSQVMIVRNSYGHEDGSQSTGYWHYGKHPHATRHLYNALRYQYWREGQTYCTDEQFNDHADSDDFRVENGIERQLSFNYHLDSNNGERKTSRAVLRKASERLAGIEPIDGMAELVNARARNYLGTTLGGWVEPLAYPISAVLASISRRR